VKACLCFSKIFFLAACFTPVLIAAWVPAQECSEHGNPLTRLTIRDIPLIVELVDTPEKISTGLSHRRELPEGRGMLFVMDVARPYAVSLRDMHFPLDIIWIAGDKVVGLHQNLAPNAAGRFTPPAPVRLVLEVPGGFADRHGIKMGDPVALQVAIPPSSAPWCSYTLGEKLDRKVRLLWAEGKNLLVRFLSSF
jgi:uncharacterized membrane protein (UPF0127 family)